MSILSCSPAVHQNNKKVVCVLFDISGSTNNLSTRQAYVHNLKIIISRLSPGDRLIVGYINSNSQAALTIPINIELPGYNESWFDNPELAKRKKTNVLCEIADTLRFVEAKVDSTIETGRDAADWTDILGSLRLTQRLFENYPSTRKILVINSDMIEDAAGYNFERINLSQAGISRIIQGLMNHGLMSSLIGVKVYVAGASAATIKRYYEIRNFWSRYFRNAGAESSDTTYGAALVRFEE